MKTKLTVALLSAAALAAGCKPDVLTEVPPRAASGTVFPTSPSTIGAQASMSLGDLSSMLAAQVPAQFSASGNGDDLCGFGGRVCAGTQYTFNASRGAPSITAVSPNTLRMSMPVSFSGTGGFRGDGCKLLKCDAKNFSGAMNVFVDLTPTIDANWCPTLSPKIDYQWTSPARVEIVGGVWVDVTQHVSGMMNSRLGDIRKAAAGAIDCGKVRPDIERSFASFSFPAKLPDGTAVHLNFQPIEVGFSGISLDANRVTAVAVLKTNVEVSTKAIEHKQIPLPALRNIPLGTPQMQVALPVRADYATLQAQLGRALAGKTFQQEIYGSKAAVTINAVEVYPSNERVVIGLELTGDLPGKWLDVKGKAYLYARPVVDGGVRVKLDQVGFARKLDNAVWTAATAVFERPIIAAITAAGSRDMTGDIAKAKAALLDELNRPTTLPGGRLALTDVNMSLGRVAVAANELSVEGLFEAKANLLVTP